MNRDIIAITGSNGVLGKELINSLNRDVYKVLILHHDIEEISELLKTRQSNLFALIHCAFARNEDPEQLSESLLFTKSLMGVANQLEIPRIINISSKSIYESNIGSNWDENTTVNPKGSYALAKYAGEVIADASIINPTCRLTHIRLASLIGPGMEQRVVTKLIRKAMQGQDITITNGAQMFQYMDIRDAAEAITALLNVDKERWKRIYCVAPQLQTSLKEIAQTVVEVCIEEGYRPVNIEFVNSENVHSGYMDTKLFCMDTGWKEKYSLKDCVKNIVSEIAAEK